jgi:hypothetical protein
MNATYGTIQDGKIIPDTPVQLPDGTRVTFSPLPPSVPVRMMTDEEQGDDTESIARWLAAFDAIPVAASSPFDDPAVAAWRETMRRHNIESMRKQMQEAPE